MLARFGSLVVTVTILAACTSDEFDVASTETTDSASSADTLAIEDSTPEDTGGGVSDSASSVDVPVAETGTCAPLASSATTIYVDGRTAKASIGTADCPTKTIREALAIVAGLPSAKRTIKVAGSADAPVEYAETGPIVLKPQLSLVGDGAGRVKISGGGACGTEECVVSLENNASIEGVTIVSGVRVGISMVNALLTTSTAKSLVVTGGTSGSAPAVHVLAKGSVDLGPELRVVKNAGVGVAIDDVVIARVNIGGTVANQFDENVAGIVVKAGTLIFAGGQAKLNTTHGVALLSNPKHFVTGLIATDNGASGLLVDGSSSLKLRSSMLVKNRIGLNFRFGTTNTLDLGTSTDLGKNFFGGSTTGLNSKAAICLPTARTTKEPAWGNKWFVCSPTWFPLSGTCEGISTYQDIYFVPNTSGEQPPLDTSACDVGT